MQHMQHMKHMKHMKQMPRTKQDLRKTVDHFSTQLLQMAGFSAGEGKGGMYSKFHPLFDILTIFHYTPSNGKDFL